MGCIARRSHGEQHIASVITVPSTPQLRSSARFTTVIPVCFLQSTGDNCILIASYVIMKDLVVVLEDDGGHDARDDNIDHAAHGAEHSESCSHHACAVEVSGLCQASEDARGASGAGAECSTVEVTCEHVSTAAAGGCACHAPQAGTDDDGVCRWVLPMKRDFGFKNCNVAAACTPSSHSPSLALPRSPASET